MTEPHIKLLYTTKMQVSQQTGRMVWYSHLFKSFPQFGMIHTVKGFSIVDETVVDVFLGSPYFFYDLVNFGNLISGSSAFSKIILNIAFANNIKYNLAHIPRSNIHSQESQYFCVKQILKMKEI